MHVMSYRIRGVSRFQGAVRPGCVAADDVSKQR